MLALLTALDVPHPEVQAAALMALGILGRAESVPILIGLTRDSAAGRHATGLPKVPLRLRAIAAQVLGLIGGHTQDNGLRLWITTLLVEIMTAEEPESRDLKFAALQSRQTWWRGWPSSRRASDSANGFCGWQVVALAAPWPLWRKA